MRGKDERKKTEAIAVSNGRGALLKTIKERSKVQGARFKGNPKPESLPAFGGNSGDQCPNLNAP